jgi:lipoprotein-anchoring transpeptidase ErfK/SrfK
MRLVRVGGDATIQRPMRIYPLVVANLVAVVAIAGSTLAAVGAGRQTDFTKHARTLEQQWSEMSAEGVAPSSLAPLESALTTSPYQAPWWSPSWWNDPGASFIASLTKGTRATWDQAMTDARIRATSALVGWDVLLEQEGAVLSASAVAASSSLISQLHTATTPLAIETLSANLSVATATETRAGIQLASSLVSNAPSNLRTLLLSADQAASEHIAGAGGFLASYHQFARAVATKPAARAVAVISAHMVAFEATVITALQRGACGHAVPSGKAIVINLTFQMVVFYQRGCAVQATPVTSGRQHERTPTGTFHVFRKVSPVLFTSWAPSGSPFWYAPERANYALEFTVVRAGIFLHDAPWEANDAYGANSENTSAASHGCVHAQTSVMKWAYSWAPTGTPVIVTD